MEKNTLERGESAGRDVLWLEGLAPPTTKHQEILSNSKNKGAIKRTNVLNVNMKDVLVTLEGEKMYVETIFREKVDGIEYLYWYSVQGKEAQNVEDSEHWIDKKHLEYWGECIDANYKPADLTTEVIMIPDKVKKNMEL